VKILSIAWECPKGYYGGLGAFLSKLLPEMAVYNDVLHICAHGGDHVGRCFSEDGLRWCIASPVRLTRGMAVLHTMGFSLACQVLGTLGAFDMVVGHDVHAAPSIIAADEEGVRARYYIHLFSGSGVEVEAARRSEKTFTNSKLNAENLARAGVEAEVVYPAPPTPETHSCGGEAVEGLEPRRYTLIFTRNQPYKWSREYLEAFSKASKKAGYTPVVAGRGWELQSLGDLAINLGSVGEETKKWLLGNAAIVIYPSVFEAFGLVPLEAIACGTPALVSRNTGVAEVLPEEAIFSTPEELADLLSDLLTNNEKREDLLKRERESWIWRRTWADVAKEILG